MASLLRHFNPRRLSYPIAAALLLFVSSSSNAQTQLAGQSCGTAVRSLSGNTLVTLTFQNQTTQTVNVAWVDYSGADRPWFTINAGGRAVQQAFTTHPWRVSTPGGTCIAVFVAGSQDATATISVQSAVQVDPYEGFFDGLSCNMAEGWARNRLTGEAVNVDLYDGDTRLLTIAANEFRPDLPGHRNYAFRVTPPASLMDLRVHTIRVKIAGTNRELTNSPRPYLCDGTAIALATGRTYDIGGGYVSAVLQKESLGGQTYRYRMSLVGPRIFGMGSMWKALLVAVYPHGVNVDRQNVRIERSRDSRNTIVTDPTNARWEDVTPPALSAREEATRALISDLIGVIPRVGYATILHSFNNLLGAGDYAPNTWFLDKLNNENQNDVLRIPHEAVTGFDLTLGFHSLENAVRFTIPSVDESSGGQPEFYLLLQLVNHQVATFEIGLDRNALTSLR
jgi:hypothetical protein